MLELISKKSNLIFFFVKLKTSLSLVSSTPQELKADIKSFMVAPDGDIFLKVAKIWMLSNSLI